jgi:hypothetical protein
MKKTYCKPNCQKNRCHIIYHDLSLFSFNFIFSGQIKMVNVWFTIRRCGTAVMVLSDIFILSTIIDYRQLQDYIYYYRL